MPTQKKKSTPTPTGAKPAPQSTWGTTEIRDGKRVYIVKPDDTLASIATELYGAPNRSWLLHAGNRDLFADPFRLTVTPGQVLWAPARQFGSRFSMQRIPAPEWAPIHGRGEVELDGIPAQDYAWLQERRPAILAVLDAAVENYVSDNTLPGDDGFPQRERLTGRFYIGHEYYSKRETLGGQYFRISLFCRCLERVGDGQGDYLGLEVYLRCDPETGACSALDVDSSAI